MARPAAHPSTDASYAIRVPQAGALPTFRLPLHSRSRVGRVHPSAFRARLATTPLLFGWGFLPTRPTKGLRLQVKRHAWHTEKGAGMAFHPGSRESAGQVVSPD